MAAHRLWGRVSRSDGKWLGICLRPTALTRRGGHWTFATPSSRQTDGPACIYI